MPQLNSSTLDTRINIKDQMKHQYFNVITLCMHALLLSCKLQAVDIQKISCFDFAKLFPQTEIMHSTGKVYFDLGRYPMIQEHEPSQPVSSGYFLDSFMLSIPNATVLFDTHEFYAYINNHFIDETKIRLMEPELLCDLNNKTIPENIVQIKGTVILLTNSFSWCYFHWINDIISKLALLDLYEIEYDYICIPQYKPYMREMLELWGIQAHKIIPAQLGMCFQAEKVIIQTSTTDLNNEIRTCSNYMQSITTHYLRKKLIPPALKKSTQQFCSKVFISRKDAQGRRPISNEDEIFQLLEQYGFQRYSLAELSLADQIALFHNATDIVSFHGAGLTNIMFCQPHTRIIEIFHNHYALEYWFLSKILNLDYTYIDGMNGQKLMHGSDIDTPFPIDLIKNHLLTKGYC